jgi:hypothetical protein
MASGLNVWIAKPGFVCRMDDTAWRVTVYDAHGTTFKWAGVTYANLSAPHAHWASAMPPGTYVVQAVNEKTGVKSDHAIVMVGCEGVSCAILYVAAPGTPNRPDRPPPEQRCRIAITDVTALGEGNMHAVLVSGTALGCPTIEVTVSCRSGPGQTTTLSVSSDGTWTTKLDLRQLECRCDGPVRVVARCTTEPNCTDVFETDRLPCRRQ